MHAVNWGVFTVVCWCERRNSSDLINALPFWCQPKAKLRPLLADSGWNCSHSSSSITNFLRFGIMSAFWDFQVYWRGLSASGQSGSKFCLTTWDRQVQILSFRLGRALLIPDAGGSCVHCELLAFLVFCSPTSQMASWNLSPERVTWVGGLLALESKNLLVVRSTGTKPMDRGHLRFQSRTSHWAKLK